MTKACRLGLLVVLTLGCGCRTSSTQRAFFPIGIYGVPASNDIVTVRDAGFNVVVGRSERAYLDAAQGLGLRVLAAPGTTAGPKFDASVARRTIAELDAHPALWAWYLVDEPDLDRMPPDTVKRANRFVRNLAHKPTALVINQGYTALHYANITDFMMIDRYPVPWLPLANFGQHVDMVRLALGPRKPLYAVIQAFDWNSAKSALPGEDNLRPPTYEEMRCMTYEALARGANGIFYFAYDSGWRMRDHPETWAALTSIVHEVRARLPLFQARRQWWARQHDLEPRNVRFNAALQSSVTSAQLRVDVGGTGVPPGDYILAVNNTTNRVTYRFKSPPSKAAGRATRPAGEEPVASDVEVPVFGEQRRIRLMNDWVQDVFEPYAVHVYGPMEGGTTRED